MMLRGFRDFFRKLQGPFFKDPVGSNEGPWLVKDPVVGGSSCVPGVPQCNFLCLEYKNMADIAYFRLQAYLPPPA